MQTEFDKWWANHSELGFVNKEVAEKIWHAAQLATIRTIMYPPYKPKVGEKVRLLSLCHRNSLGKVKEVTAVYEDALKVFQFESKCEHDGEPVYSGGILGEVEKVDE